MKESKEQPLVKLLNFCRRGKNKGWNWKYMAFALEKGYKDPDEAFNAHGNNAEYMIWIDEVSLEFRNTFGIPTDFGYPLSGAEKELYDDFISKRAVKFIK